MQSDVGFGVADSGEDTREAQLAFPGPELTDRVRRAVTEAAGRDAEAMKRLRIAVTSFTIALREIGTTPEAVLIALKTAINSRALMAVPLSEADLNLEDLRGKISTWCIEEFFSSYPR